jgi:hypothetical protein
MGGIAPILRALVSWSPTRRVAMVDMVEMILVTRVKLSSLYRNGDMFYGGMPTIATISTISTLPQLCFRPFRRDAPRRRAVRLACDHKFPPPGRAPF